VKPACNKQFGVRGGVTRRNLCAILQVLLQSSRIEPPPEPIRRLVRQTDKEASMIEYRSMSAKAKESVRKMLEAISEEDTTAFEDFPEILKTPKVCLAAVKKNGYVIESVPASLITPELCIATVKQNGYAIGVIPKAFITTELCFLAVENDTGDSILETIPAEFLTQELCLYAVKKCGYLLRYVPFVNALDKT